MRPGAALGAVLGLAAAGGLLLVLVALIGSPGRRRPTRRSRLAELIRAADVPGLTASRIVVACAVLALVTGLVGVLVTAVPVVGLLAAAVAGVLPVVALRRRAAHRSAAVSAAWPEAVDALASGVRAGLALPEAVAALARRGPAALRPAFTRFEAEYHATGSFTAALDDVQSRLADPVADRVVSALRIAREVGGTDLGIVLRTLAALLREDTRLRGEIAARQSWTVSAARLAVAAPWITLALLCTRPEAARAYASVAGGAVLVGAAIISVLAYWVMLRIGRLPRDERLAS